MEIRRTTWAEAFERPEFGRLLADYSSESGSPFMKGAPDPAEYIAAEEAGQFILLGAFEGDRFLGGINLSLYRIPHYAEPLAAVESIYLDKPYRKGAAGLRLLRAAEDAAREAGAKVLMVGTRCGSRFEEMCRRLYTPVNTVFQAQL